MPIVTYAGKTYHCRKNENLLDALRRQGLSLEFSCREGICQVCLVRQLSGTIDPHSQIGIKSSLKDLGYILPCRCHPDENLEIAAPRADDLFTHAVVASKELLNSAICRIQLEPTTDFNWRAGQFVNLRRPDGLTRSYSLASIRERDYFMELHVRRMKDGQMSNWLFDELQVNDQVEIQGPSGENFYNTADRQQPFLLVCTGTGLAPLWGLAQDALENGHTGPVHLYHGSRRFDGLYLHETLTGWQERYSNFHYHPCVSGGDVPAGIRNARADSAALLDHDTLYGWRVHLSGVPAMVYATRTAVCRAGVKEADVQIDPFELKELRSNDSNSTAVEFGRRKTDREYHTAAWRKAEVDPPKPDPQLWAALKQGVLLSEILSDFYTRVYADSRLSPFFKNVTKRRLIEKQYSFLKRLFTGEQIYFGERPRNAHHWMVISDELFDYREALLLQVAREHGLDEMWIERWHAIEAMYRPDIVKEKPWPKVVAGIEIHRDGFDEIVLDEGSQCDSCRQAIDKGQWVRYHTRTGEIYCTACASL